MIALAAGAAALTVVFTVWVICRSAWRDPDDLDALINATREPRPAYRHRVACCPDCGQDLDDEGFGFWCSGCQCAWPFSHVIFPEDADDDLDRSIDDN